MKFGARLLHICDEFSSLDKTQKCFPCHGSVSLFTQLGQINVEKCMVVESPTCHNASTILNEDI